MQTITKLLKHVHCSVGDQFHLACLHLRLSSYTFLQLTLALRHLTFRQQQHTVSHFAFQEVSVLFEFYIHASNH